VITKPSITDLVEGMARNLEHVIPDPSAPSTGVILTDVLGVLDRAAGEWCSMAEHLACDNADIRTTLRTISVATGLGVVLDDVDDGVDDDRSVDSLAARNRALKSAVVRAVADLDLPAGPDAAVAVRQADADLLALMSRILRREEAAGPRVPPRVSPTSGGAADVGSVDLVARRLREFLLTQMPDATGLTLTDVAPMSGGASREAWRFDASWTDAGGDHVERCVMLREPVSSVLESDDSADRITGSRRLAQTEFDMIRAMAAQGLPVPHVLWVDQSGGWIDRPFSVARLLPGTADVAPLVGTDAGVAIMREYVELLVRVHAIDPAAAGVDFLGHPTVETAALEQVELFELGYHKQAMEAFPAIEYMIRWLKRHQPVAAKVSVVHGDFRLGNFMYEGDHIVALLDWEQVHLGDPVEEIAFMYWALWSLAAFVPIDELVTMYEAAGGTHVDLDALAYYRVFIELKMLVVLLTGLKSYFATPNRQLRYGAATAGEMMRDAQLRVIEELANGGPTVAFDAYRPSAG
jgi:aminoglycoside phosphotransferase (APT) family kinase protein